MFRIDAPPVNALATSAREFFVMELESVERDLDVRAIIVTGTGNAFCSGDDLREAATRGTAGPESLRQFALLIDRLDSFRVPVIAAINGYTLGGGLELALACDIRVGATDASFTAAGVNVGLMASVYRLPRTIGVARAKSMLLTGLPIDAQTALEWGLLTALVAPDDLADHAVQLAERIASRAPLSVEAAKRQIGKALDLTPAESEREVGAEIAVLSASHDHREAVRAFGAKEQPRFTRS
jgi:enoyl-CoA hydratase